MVTMVNLNDKGVDMKTGGGSGKNGDGAITIMVSLK